MNRKQKNLIKKRKRVQQGVRRRVRGSQDKPRICICRSNKNLSCQAIADDSGTTITSISSLEKDFRGKLEGTKTDCAKALGTEMAKRLKEKGVERIVFDRGWYRYHGRVKAFADAIREEGVRF